jgi:putative DNA primase/helicase
VKGCLEWQQIGLVEPDEVRNATQGYRDEEDALREFISDRCKLELKSTAEKSKLWISYTAWCTANREEQLSRREFSNRLTEKGLISKKGTAGIRIWEGIRLLEANELTGENKNSGKVAQVADCSENHYIEKFDNTLLKTTPQAPLTPQIVSGGSSNLAAATFKCFCCKSTEYWTRASGEKVCSKCHPDPKTLT